jgi:hypothetical protein
MQTLLYPTGVPLWPVCRAAVRHTLHSATPVGDGFRASLILQFSSRRSTHVVPGRSSALLFLCTTTRIVLPDTRRTVCVP